MCVWCQWTRLTHRHQQSRTSWLPAVLGGCVGVQYPVVGCDDVNMALFRGTSGPLSPSTKKTLLLHTFISFFLVFFSTSSFFIYPFPSLLTPSLPLSLGPSPSFLLSFILLIRISIRIIVVPILPSHWCHPWQPCVSPATSWLSQTLLERKMAARGGRTVQPPPLLQLKGGREEESRTFSHHFILAILFLLHFYLLFFIQPWIYFSPAILTLSFLHAHNALPPDTQPVFSEI